MGYAFLFDGPRAGEVVDVGDLREYTVFIPQRINVQDVRSDVRSPELAIPTAVTYRPTLLWANNSDNGIWSIYGPYATQAIVELLAPIVKQIRLEVQERLHDG